MTKRNTVADYAVTILLLLFGATSIAMEDNLLVGDHLLVDKMAYTPSGSIAKHLLYTEVQRTARKDHVIDLAQNFFTKTRWNRTFKLIRRYPLET